MTVSMTGFAARKGQGAGFVWAWDIRSVNGKGLDLRLRLPDWVDGLELALRTDVQKALSRGNVSLSLKVSREGAEAESGLRVNTPVLGAVLAALQQVEGAAMDAGVTLAQATAADVLAVRGVLETASMDDDTGPLRAALMADLPALLTEFAAMRATEGAALQKVIAGQLSQIETLTTAAKAQADARRDTAAASLRDALARVLDHADGADAGRVAQELALIAVKQDVTEELDRLAAHIDAARTLLADTGPVGRKFDFLMQEFMREANTLCAKAQALALTRIGLDLKTVIDQMREQVQNVE
ncbi:MAG: YicC/YloC family endoribonuclease [Pseudotabrizicola sp.]|uniref:YicC/YloC family endoribonuclease n=1 Tax=Pseudotabrizicola sp. TaxID=2939647 RepID=UPI00271CA018|nr:YicC/YloC family endoribonuclease [Pseudotabrizicola sp.]MDO8884410.1 YicC/YloC family endoribonuclease [Pseudotabrizicola sp.]MDP2082806.1 YicC/YloC family endoribonuclease [Pseudotabrizicola sp.]MDZ7576221.1 YicC/YloC family endoribonuclease [Pseudotabrizicola sp.]